jgi:hypothetical protein
VNEQDRVRCFSGISQLGGGFILDTTLAYVDKNYKGFSTLAFWV